MVELNKKIAQNSYTYENISFERRFERINEGTEKKFHEIYILNFIYFIFCGRIGHATIDTFANPRITPRFLRGF